MNTDRFKFNFLRSFTGLLFCGLVLAGQSACSSGGIADISSSTGPTSPRTNSKSSERPDLVAQDAGDDSDDNAEEPAKISGAFLVCGGDVLSDNYGAADMDAPYGCAVLDKDYKKQPGCTAPKDILVTMNAGSAKTTLTRAAADDSSWLFYFTAPYDEKLSLVDAHIDCAGSLNSYSAVDPWLNYAMPLVNEVMAGKVHLLFVTSDQYQGNLGGLVGADQKCRDAAVRNPDIGGDLATTTNQNPFIALLSSSTSSIRERAKGNKPVVNSAWERVVATNKMWFNPNSLAPLIHLERPILDEQGNAKTGKVWTGSHPDGQSYIAYASSAPKAQLTCDDWTKTSAPFSPPKASYGLAEATDHRWITGATPPTFADVFPNSVMSCSTQASLYCISP